MPNQPKSIKTELLAPALKGGREGSGWRQQLEPSCWMFHAPGCQKSYHSSTKQRLPAEAAWAWLPVSLPATTRCMGVKGFCKSQPGWTERECLSSCSGIYASCFGSFTVPGRSQPCIPPADGELTINQCLFSMIQLQSPVFTLADSSLTKIVFIQNGEVKAFA